MQGVLSLYDTDKKLAFFQSGPIQSTSCLVFIGGMGGGFLTLDYFEDLSSMLAEIGWSTVQLLLSSSYAGYSYGSLDADGQEIMSLVKHLVNKCGKTKIFLVGHSTGCQDVLWYFNHYYDPAHNVVAAILKSPVSDREAFEDDLPNFKEILDWAMDKCEKGFPKTVYPKMIGGTPFTAYRLKSLLKRMDDDDFFSTDFTDEERAKKFGKIPVPTYVFFGKCESNVKGGVAGMQDLGKSFAKVSPNIKFMPLVENGDHCFSHPDAVNTFLKHIREIIEKNLS